MSDARVSVTWRNNSADYLGVVHLRRDHAAPGGLAPVDTVGDAVASFADSGLQASHWYTYALVAFWASEVSDTSNRDSVQALGPMACTGPLRRGDTTAGPWLDNAQWVPAAMTAALTVRENACDEAGVVILRAEGSGPLAPVAVRVHPATAVAGTRAGRTAALFAFTCSQDAPDAIVFDLAGRRLTRHTQAAANHDPQRYLLTPGAYIMQTPAEDATRTRGPTRER